MLGDLLERVNELAKHVDQKPGSSGQEDESPKDCESSKKMVPRVFKPPKHED